MARRLILRSGRLLALVAAVLALHACVGSQVALMVAGWSAESAMPPRLQVAYVREMRPTEPGPAPSLAPAVLEVPSPRPERQAAAVADPLPATPAASAPLPERPEVPELPADTVAVIPPAPAPASPPASDAAAVELAPAVAAASGPEAPIADKTGVATADGPPFAWPPSTRLSFRLTGQYRGEVSGQAQVEWVLAAPRYQVHLDVTLGLPSAPLFSRRMSSDGRLTAKGLRPERYDEVSKMAFRDPRRVRVQLDEDSVLLADGQRWAPPAPLTPADLGGSAVQDSASQFVQLSYLFTVQPELLTPGRSIAFPLALPRRVEPWVYEVVGAQTQYTPFGPIDTFHVRPRRGTPRGNDLLAEAWFAPQLGYLPVRIRIEQDAEVYIDLVLDRPPQLAAR